MKNRSLYIWVAISAVLIGIFYLIYNEKEVHLKGNYYWNEEFGLIIKNNDSDVSHVRLQRTNEIAWNEHYIAAKTYALENRREEYYVIDIENDNFLLNSDEVLIGPLDEADLAKYKISISDFKIY